MRRTMVLVTTVSVGLSTQVLEVLRIPYCNFKHTRPTEGKLPVSTVEFPDSCTAKQRLYYFYLPPFVVSRIWNDPRKKVNSLCMTYTTFCRYTRPSQLLHNTTDTQKPFNRSSIPSPQPQSKMEACNGVVCTLRPLHYHKILPAMRMALRAQPPRQHPRCR